MHLVSLLVTIVSSIITISTTVIAICLINHFRSVDKNKPLQRNATINNKCESVQINIYFKLTASITLIFNSLNAFFNSVYCFYLLFDPVCDNEIFYVYHPSHIQRITSTVSWYIAKVALIWFFTGRLYHGFKNSSLSINRKIMLFINSFNTVFAPISLFFAYWSVYNNYLIFAEFAFNTWRIQYQIVVCLVVCLFSKRLLFLTMRELHNTDSHCKQQRISFLMITTRNAILVFTISFTVALVTFCFFGFRFIFGPQTRLTLLIPMNMAAVDSLCTSICMICLFSTTVGDKLYYSLCKSCDKNVYKLFTFMAKKKQITNAFGFVNDNRNIPNKLLRITNDRPLLNINTNPSPRPSNSHLETNNDLKQEEVAIEIALAEPAPVPVSETLNVTMLQIVSRSHSEPVIKYNHQNDTHNTSKSMVIERHLLLDTDFK